VPGGQGPAPLVGLGCGSREFRPTGVRINGAKAAQDFAKGCHECLVFGAFCCGQIEVQDDGVEGGQEFAREIVDTQLVDRGADQLGEARGCLTLGWCGGQSQTHGRNAHVQGFVALTRAEVVGLVDDQKLKTVAELAHVAPAALKGGHGNGLDLMLAVAQSAGREPSAFMDGARPLIEEHARGHQAQRWHAQTRDGRNRQPRLARARRQHSHSTSVSQRPRCQCCLLVRT